MYSLIFFVFYLKKVFTIGTEILSLFNLIDDIFINKLNLNRDNQFNSNKCLTTQQMRPRGKLWGKG